MRLLSILALSFFTSALAFLHAESYDLIIRGGRLIDGTGTPAAHADLAIRQGRLAAIGKLQGQAAMTIEASGLIVAPGFIDVHTHAENIEELPLAENFLRMGVTTLVLGNCGGSRLKIAQFFTKLERAGISPNVATLIGHNTVRSEVMGGSFRRPPTEEELDRMKALVGQAMKEGAVGLSTGLIYLPGTFATTDEIIDLAKVASAHDGIYVSHIRDEGAGIFDALDELFRIAREANIRAQISHLKLSGRPSWGRAREVIKAVEEARAEGLDITQDQYAYTASSTGISQLIPATAREGGQDRFLERIRQPDQKAQLVREMKEKLQRAQQDSYAYALIAHYDKDPSLNGKNLVEAARLKRNSDSLDDQIELILDIQANGGATGVFFGIDEEDLRLFMQHPNTMFASDSSVRRIQEGIPHPRGYGNNARVLARYVQELKLFRLEEAIRRMTSLPANTFGLQDRGQLRRGNWADIVVFDPGKVRDVSTFGDPHHCAIGFEAVLVNGVVVVKNDRHTGARPGKVLRHRTVESTAPDKEE
jgi:N-acyl-D-amino-acid deacylase